LRRCCETLAGTYDNADVENVIAVEVRLADGQRRYFLTWGRIQERLDPGPVEALILRHSAAGYSLGGGTPVAARVCYSLREAAVSPEAPYFYECFIRFCQERIPFGHGYASWRAAKAAAMSDGGEIAYCGFPQQPAGVTDG
jgi:hypothetical protein